MTELPVLYLPTIFYKITWHISKLLVINTLFNVNYCALVMVVTVNKLEGNVAIFQQKGNFEKICF